MGAKNKDFKIKSSSRIWIKSNTGKNSERLGWKWKTNVNGEAWSIAFLVLSHMLIEKFWENSPCIRFSKGTEMNLCLWHYRCYWHLWFLWFVRWLAIIIWWLREWTFVGNQEQRFWLSSLLGFCSWQWHARGTSYRLLIICIFSISSQYHVQWHHTLVV